MRQRFEQRMNLRTVAVSDVKFSLKSRNELPPVLMALQYIFITPELNEQVFALLEHHGLDSCMDKGPQGYKRCVALSVLAYNLHIPGNAITAKARTAEANKERRSWLKAA